MWKETMVDLEENAFRDKTYDPNNVLHEYETLVASLKEDLENCRIEQRKLCVEIQNLRKDNEIANETIRQSLVECDHQKCVDIEHNEEALRNLEKRITLLQMEKDSVTQLWQMALKAIDVLEEELRTVHKEEKSTKYYQEQINNIKESYSEAIIVLESRLEAAKESFFQQQTVWERNKEKIEQLTKQKNDIVQQLNNAQQQTSEKEKSFQAIIDTLKEDLSHTKYELEQIKKNKTELEEKLKHAQVFANTMLSKDFEAKSKVAEAVDLVEAAVKEKEIILKREAQVVEEKAKLETCLAKLSEDYTSRLDKELSNAKEIYNRNIKKYLLEIKELKAELREQGTLLDRSKRECRLVEEELEKVKCGSNNYVQKSNVRILNLEQTVQEKDLKLQTSQENYRTAYDDRIQYLERQITYLQDKLSNTSEKLRRVHLQSSKDVEDHVREADDRTREIMEKCTNFERQLSRALFDKENLTTDLRTLEMSFEKEMQKRNLEKLHLENQVRALQEKMINTEGFINKSVLLNDVTSKKNSEQQTSVNLDSISNILALQEKFDKKTKELTQHVEIHQKLSNKWKEEANNLTSKFQKRTQELKNKISALQNQNQELSKELLFYQQLFARCNTQVVQNFNKDSEAR